MKALIKKISTAYQKAARPVVWAGIAMSLAGGETHAGIIDFDDITLSPSFAAVPEPSSLALMGLGFMGLGAGYMRRRGVKSC